LKFSKGNSTEDFGSLRIPQAWGL